MTYKYDKINVNQKCNIHAHNTTFLYPLASPQSDAGTVASHIRKQSAYMKFKLLIDKIKSNTSEAPSLSINDSWREENIWDELFIVDLIGNILAILLIWSLNM